MLKYGNIKTQKWEYKPFLSRHLLIAKTTAIIEVRTVDTVMVVAIGRVLVWEFPFSSGERRILTILLFLFF
jgi:hypothetical protein